MLFWYHGCRETLNFSIYLWKLISANRLRPLLNLFDKPFCHDWINNWKYKVISVSRSRFLCLKTLSPNRNCLLRSTFTEWPNRQETCRYYMFICMKGQKVDYQEWETIRHWGYCWSHQGCFWGLSFKSANRACYHSWFAYWWGTNYLACRWSRRLSCWPHCFFVSYNFRWDNELLWPWPDICTSKVSRKLNWHCTGSGGVILIEIHK